MTVYNLVGLLILILVAGYFFELEEPIHEIFVRLSDIPPFEDKGDNPALFDLAVRLAYLIALVALVRAAWKPPRA